MKSSIGTLNILFERICPALGECVNRDKTIIITDKILFKYYPHLMEGCFFLNAETSDIVLLNAEKEESSVAERINAEVSTVF